MTIIERVKRARQGDETAFLELFQQYEADIYRTAYAYVGNPEDALDIVQETAYRSFKSIGGLKEPKYFKTWLIKIAMGCAVDLFRKRKQEAAWRPEYGEALTIGDENDDLPLSLSLRTWIEALDADEKHVILLRYYYDYTIREMAEIMDIPLGTGKTLLYRALRKLRMRAEAEGENEYA
ncbi:sigma-70 family RNA polymerase sigma factor [Paenibacillus rhizovicinus]|uniref:Sigma-70 family RNA polymerase sigma factor n=1 Tax=Paenibacillus rhizovicinus TaxID=2704463 RepID=A0A6C0P612_9BACL|nr:sigma-70 family RNA polymerase sigma factor [Paenibacillus rhizovicinus]QHW32052.1 sigma-70 family RNA polymerase sigma factor [Paenibacillus rhizovicinus]